MKTTKQQLTRVFCTLGGQGSGNKDHAGRPGEVGGSFANWQGGEVDNTKGQRGYGNRVFEYRAKKGKVVVVVSKYSSAMRTGSTLSPHITILHFDAKGKWQAEMDKDFKGDRQHEKTAAYLKKEFGIDWKA